jgi:hypothetical protein
MSIYSNYQPIFIKSINFISILAKEICHICLLTFLFNPNGQPKEVNGFSVAS